jgi:hypothetical protein
MSTPKRQRRQHEKGETSWEDVLRAGQEAEGHTGTLADALAVVQMLRHAGAAGPARLSDAELDDVWKAIEPEIRAEPWWRRPWVRWAAPMTAAAAAAALLVVLWPGDRKPMEKDSGTVVTAEPIRTNAQALERQFAALAPTGRAKISASVDQGRSTLRAELLAMAMDAGDGASAGGAP